MKAIEIDGADGGGQVLRTALTLAMVSGRGFRMVNLRGGRSRPGLMRQHLTCVKAACEISDGSCDGAEIGSTELIFHGGQVRAGEYRFSIGTAGSTSLLFQTLLPALLTADGPSTLRLEGGTHNPMAPPFEFIDQVFLPVMRKMGAEVALELRESGFAPVGGGAIEAVVQPSDGLRAIEFHDRGALESLKLRVLTRNLRGHIAERVLTAARHRLPCEDAEIEIREPGPGRGICCQFSAISEQGAELCTSFGESNVSSERVGDRAAKALSDFIGSKAAVGRHLADQLLLPLALAGGGGFTTFAPGNHVRTNIHVIEAFLPVKFHLVAGERGTCRIEVHPVAAGEPLKLPR